MGMAKKHRIAAGIFSNPYKLTRAIVKGKPVSVGKKDSVSADIHGARQGNLHRHKIGIVRGKVPEHLAVLVTVSFHKANDGWDQILKFPLGIDFLRKPGKLTYAVTAENHGIALFSKGFKNCHKLGIISVGI